MTRYATDTRCWLCGRIDDGAGVNVTVEGRIEWMCSYCEDKTYVEVPLDYTTDEGDDDDA